MTRTAIEAIAGGAAFLIALLLGYACRRRARKISALAAERNAILSIAPLMGGLISGCAVLLMFSGYLFQEDRFHSVAQSRGLVLMLAVLPGLLLLVDLITPRVPKTDQRNVPSNRHGLSRWQLFLLLELLCATLAVLAGVRFPILGIAGSQAMELGPWAVPLTMLWIVVAINATKLLDGLHGAASILVLVAALKVWYSTWGTSEYLLQAISILLSAAVLGSIPYNLYPAPLRLSGGGTAYLGFLFAVLTVLARQKSVAVLAVLFPLLLSVALIGAAMFGLLERNLVLDKEKD